MVGILNAVLVYIYIYMCVCVCVCVCVCIMKLLLCNVCYTELFTRKI